MGLIEEALGRKPTKEALRKEAATGIVSDTLDFIGEVAKTNPELIVGSYLEPPAMYLRQWEYMLELSLSGMQDEVKVSYFEPQGDAEHLPRGYRYRGLLFTISTHSGEVRKHFGTTDDEQGLPLKYKKTLELRNQLNNYLFRSQNLPEQPLIREGDYLFPAPSSASGEALPYTPPEFETPDPSER